MSEAIETLIIGAGQAGLSLSYHLTQRGMPHLVLEQAERLANPWRNQRWDSFTLVTPNWLINLPGGEYQGAEPDGFMPRDEVVSYLEGYAASFRAPVCFGQQVTAVARHNSHYLVQTTQGDYRAANVVIATGIFQKPHIPAYRASLPGGLNQLHTGEYRNPAKLPPGAVLVVGSAQSGCQIAEELYQSGRKVYLSVGASSGRVPRKYRGQEILRWLVQTGFFEQTFEQAPPPKNKFAGNPQISGKDGGHTLNVHKFARQGVTLLGRMNGAQGDKLSFAPDLRDSLEKIDNFEDFVVSKIDEFIAAKQIKAPGESLLKFTDGYKAEIITELDIEKCGITSLIWGTGYKYDYSWVHLPVFDSTGFPLQADGITDSAGLYFLGLPWQRVRGSGGLYGIGEDAATIASHLAERRAH